MTDKINDGQNNTYDATIGLMIAIPFVGRPVSPEWALALAAQNYPLNVSRSFYVVGGSATDVARNQAVEHALEKKSRYIWFLDDDVQPPFTALRQLIYTLEQCDDKTMVSTGIYFAKINPTEPVIYRGKGQGAFWKWKQNEKFEVDGCGAGCMVVKTELFKHLEKPYFKTIDDKTPGEGIIGNSSTEDLYFCHKVRSAGFKIIADGGIICGHWDIKNMKCYTAPSDSYPMTEEKAA